MSIKISIIIPLFNKSAYVARAINSVLRQSYQAFELIVVDDGSTDDSLSTVEKIKDDRIRVIKKENGGVSSARNRGIQEAKADIIAFLDADDAYKRDFLERVMQMHHEYPNAGGYAMNFDIVYDSEHVSTGVQTTIESITVLSIDNYFKMAVHGSPLWSSAVAIRKAVFERVGTFPVGVKLGEDLDTWIRILFEFPIIFNRSTGASYFRDATERACKINPPPLRPIFFDTLDQRTKHRAVSKETAADIHEFKNFFIQLYAIWQIKYVSAVEGRRAFLTMKTRIFLFNKLKWVALSFVPRVLLKKILDTRESTSN